jgi:hypothetical protein
MGGRNRVRMLGLGQILGVAEPSAGYANGAASATLADIDGCTRPTNGRAHTGLTEIQPHAWEKFYCFTEPKSHAVALPLRIVTIALAASFTQSSHSHVNGPSLPALKV